MKYTALLTGSLIMVCLLITGGGCKHNQEKAPASAQIKRPEPRRVEDIRSYRPSTACSQALRVIENNPYDEELFLNAFDRIVELCRNAKSPDNADIIWQGFVSPLCRKGTVPPDLAKTTWNYYFAKQYVSLPSRAPVRHYCHCLPEIKKNIEKEYELKKKGFAVTEQGSAESHFLNAMYVYNTMWAHCNRPN